MVELAALVTSWAGCCCCEQEQAVASDPQRMRQHRMCHPDGVKPPAAQREARPAVPLDLPSSSYNQTGIKLKYCTKAMLFPL